MIATDSFVDFLPDSPDLSRVNAPEIWESVAALIEYSVNNMVPCCSELHSPLLIFLRRQDPRGKVRHDRIHPAWPCIYRVNVHALGIVDAGFGKILYSDSLEVRL